MLVKPTSNLKAIALALAFYLRFLPSFTQPGYAVRRWAWRKESLDFSGQHWLITGASAGLGRALAVAAAAAGARVTAVARASDRLVALGVASERTAGRIETMPCDFSSIADTRRWLAEFLARGTRVDVLVNNVGVLNDAHELTAEGHEASYAINLLSHYHITESLLARAAFAPGARVIGMTSGGAYHAPLCVALLDVKDSAHYDGTRAYALHKRAQIALDAHWRARHADPAGPQFYVMHPGWVDTEGVRRSLPNFRRYLAPLLRDDAAGIDTALWLAARRPACPAAAHVWFDRKPRTAHVFERTRHGDAVATLLAQLERDLQPRV